MPIISFSAVLDRLQVAPVGSLPGLGPFDGRVDLEDSQGEVTLSGAAMTLPWPSYTSQVLQVDELKAVITLDAQNTQRLQVGADVELADQGIQSSTRLKALSRSRSLATPGCPEQLLSGGPQGVERAGCHAGR